ncbi:MAG: phenylalanine--tRNA ligase subunit alpha [Candidatus Bipolaricaulota bacterium]|nr:phenylalanine--tRNA ligase subunit alpha [Candidatus Bipolaricaulota bacterium]
MGDLSSLGKTIADLNGEMARGLASVNDTATLEAFRVEYLGRKGRVSQLFKVLADVSSEEKGEAGRLLNELRDEITRAFEERATTLSGCALEERLTRESVDMTLPGIGRAIGHMHPLTRVQREIESIFLRMGFDVATGPEIETEYYNFEALNIPADHPARADWDTFYISDTTLLRPHTSPVQIHVMESTSPPVRIICPGRCYRRDAQDATHSPVFHQIELLWVEEGLSLANLKYVLELFTREYFGEGYTMRFSGDFFPFTEPSVQVHIKAPGASRWLEIMGAGMVDPAVLSAVGYDPDRVSGFAFGLGIERMAMLKYGIDDIRAFLTNDLRFIRQF